jgi:uncharacterized protein (DUF433 family)
LPGRAIAAEAWVRDVPIVEETPGVGGGYPQVRGTRTPVRCIVETFRQTDDFDQTAAMFPHLSRQQVRAALDYYILHPARIEEDILRNKQALAELQRGG